MFTPIITRGLFREPLAVVLLIALFARTQAPSTAIPQGKVVGSHLGRNGVIGPGFNNTDLSISKNIQLGERMGARRPSEPKRALVLYWYNKDHPWNVRFDQGFQAALQSVPAGTVEYYPEYLETDRFPGEKQSLLLQDYLRQKYADRTIDVVIANRDVSLDFLLKRRDDLFPHTPIVFVATRHPAKEELAAGPGLTGVIDVNTHRKTLDLALSLHPNTEQVFVISGTLQHDKKFEAVAREELRGYEGKIRVTYLTDLAQDELVAKMKKLPERSIVLYVWQQSQNEQGKVIESSDTFALIAQSARVPIYGMSYPLLGKGIVGGYIVTSEVTGARIAEIALRIANGARAQDIPVEGAPTVPMFDWRQLRRLGISEYQLPPGSVIRFKEQSFWRLYKWRVIGAISICAVEALLILGLLAQRARRRRVEEELRDNEDRLNLALSAANMGAWDWRLDTNELTWSDETRRIFDLANRKSGITPEAFIDLIYKDDRPVVSEAVTRTLKQGATYDVEFRLERQDGSERWLMSKGKALLDEGGRASRMLGVYMDITARKQGEEALRKSEERYRSVVESQTELICRYLPDTTLTFVNDAYCRYFGKTWEDLIGMKFLELIPEDSRDYVRGLIESLSQRPRTETYEHEVLLPDGGIGWQQWVDHTIRDASGKIVEFQAVGRDITERKRAEQSLRESDDALRESYARIEDLAGRLIAAQEDERSHIARELHDDLNQQVAALAIGISRIKRQFPDIDFGVREQLAKLREKTELLSERIRQVSHELHSSVLQHVGLPAALNSYCAEFSEREGIAVALDIQDGLGALPSDTALCLYRVAQESLRNVARHSGARSAIVALTRVNGAVELRVTDQGVGFDPGQAREFRGLGLISMEERVKLLRGSFVLTTRPGAGTELRAQIPLRRGHEPTKSIVG
jgi:PAS domain S-box-containing protein